MWDTPKPPRAPYLGLVLHELPGGPAWSRPIPFNWSLNSFYVGPHCTAAELQFARAHSSALSAARQLVYRVVYSGVAQCSTTGFYLTTTTAPGGTSETLFVTALHLSRRLVEQSGYDKFYASSGSLVDDDVALESGTRMRLGPAPRSKLGDATTVTLLPVEPVDTPPRGLGLADRPPSVGDMVAAICYAGEAVPELIAENHASLPGSAQALLRDSPEEPEYVEQMNFGSLVASFFRVGGITLSVGRVTEVDQQRGTFRVAMSLWHGGTGGPVLTIGANGAAAVVGIGATAILCCRGFDVSDLHLFSRSCAVACSGTSSRALAMPLQLPVDVVAEPCGLHALVVRGPSLALFRLAGGEWEELQVAADAPVSALPACQPASAPCPRGALFAVPCVGGVCVLHAPLAADVARCTVVRLPAGLSARSVALHPLAGAAELCVVCRPSGRVLHARVDLAAMCAGVPEDLSAALALPEACGPLGSCATGQAAHVFFVSSNGHVHEAYRRLPGGPWCHVDLTAACCAPPASPCRPLACCSPGGLAAVFYVGADGLLDRLAWTPRTMWWGYSRACERAWDPRICCGPRGVAGDDYGLHGWASHDSSKSELGAALSVFDCASLRSVATRVTTREQMEANRPRPAAVALTPDAAAARTEPADPQEFCGAPLRRWQRAGRRGPLRAPGSLRVVTYNVLFHENAHGALRHPRLLDVVRAEDPDVVCLQEVTPPFLAQLLATAWVRDSYWISDCVGDTVTPYGTVMLARVPAAALTVTELPSRLCRRAIAALFEFEGNRSLAVVTAHLESFPEDSEWRRAQLACMAALAQQSPDAVIAGDFNFGDGPEDAGLPEGYADLWPLLHAGEGGGDGGVTFDPQGNGMTGALGSTRRARLDRVLLRSQRCAARECPH
eukprot:m51a1_g7909 putative endonuclease exonuclease phosphatase family protein (898) ;mRNA; r:169301-174200